MTKQKSKKAAPAVGAAAQRKHWAAEIQKTLGLLAAAQYVAGNAQEAGHADDYERATWVCEPVLGIACDRLEKLRLELAASKTAKGGDA